MKLVIATLFWLVGLAVMFLVITTPPSRVQGLHFYTTDEVEAGARHLGSEPIDPEHGQTEPYHIQPAQGWRAVQPAYHPQRGQ